MSSLIQDCKAKLLQLKTELLNRARSAKRELEMFEMHSGDEADQTMSLMAENEFLTQQQRIKEQLLEVEFALARIESGRYGICEETEEAIEPERLRALPWTRVSIEGAELREAMRKKYAR
jgi:DnaK suppressor protein